MASDTDDFAALLARIEGLSGGDREVDGRIMFELFAKPCGERGYLWPEDNPSWSFALVFSKPVDEKLKERERRAAAREHETPKEWIELQLPDGRWLLMNDLRVPRLTSSLDAALALVERSLPDAYPSITRNVTDPKHPDVLAWSAEIFRPHTDNHVVEGQGASAPIALLAALIRSLQHAE